MMSMVPQWITQDMFAAALAQAGSMNAPTRLADVRLRQLSEGHCVQTLHVGPSDVEGQVLDQTHNVFIPNQSLSMEGKHHGSYPLRCAQSCTAETSYYSVPPGGPALAQVWGVVCECKNPASS